MVNFYTNFHFMHVSSFPTTRYQGSKRKIIPWIYNNIKDLEFNSVLDMFGGTASVSYLFKKMGKCVTYNDYLKFNYLTGTALIKNNNIKLSKEDVNSLFKGDATGNFINKHFSNIYYLDSENRWLDRISSRIINMNHYSSEILEYKKSIAYYALFQSCLVKRPFNLFHRKNLNLRTNKVERNFGNSTTWEKPFKELFNKFVNEANNAIFDNGHINQVLNLNALDIPPLDYDLIYLDPPYKKKDKGSETTDYIKTYHFLEGLSQYKKWSDWINYGTINLRFKDTYISENFDITNDLEKIFEKFNKSIIVISYKRGGIPSINTIVQKLKKVKKTVYTRSTHYKYALNHQNGDASKNREVLIIGL
jgi:adenine-specific DNA-methyltransferase